MNLSPKESHALRLSDMVEESQQMLLPIEGYEKMPLVTIDDAIKPLISIVRDVKRMVWHIKPNCQNPSDNLSSDESASIMLYSLEWEPRENSFYIILNNTLRNENRNLLQPWFLYLKLFTTALLKIPSKSFHLYRGVKKDIHADYPEGKAFVWWGFSSCTSSIDVLQNEKFLGQTGTRTLFIIDCHSGKDICQHSMFKKENEILLLAARQFKVMSSMDSGHGLHIIRLKEIDPLYPLLANPLTSDAFASVKVVQSSMKTQNSAPYINDIVEQIIGKCQTRKLNLSGQRLNDQDMETVVQQGIIGKQCISLNLMCSEITQRSVSILADALLNNTYLEELDISHNSISDSGVRLLASVINSSVLKRIDLEENDITDEGVKYLVEMLETNTNLLRLSLTVNRISHHGVNMLASVLTRDNTRLEFLNLSANIDVSDKCVDSLVDMMEHNRSLKRLDLRHCDLTEDGKARLRAVATMKKGFDLWLSRSM